MCLNIKPKSRLQTALKDIVVYKHVIKTSTEGCFKTSFQGSNIEIGQTYTSVIERSESDLIITRALHSYKSKSICDSQAQHWGEVLVKCLIPKGSTYYIGIFEEKGVSYASDTLTYVKVLKDYTPC